MKGYYAIVQVIPDLARHEGVNVGLILGCDTWDRVLIELSNDPRISLDRHRRLNLKVILRGIFYPNEITLLKKEEDFFEKVHKFNYIYHNYKLIGPFRTDTNYDMETGRKENLPRLMEMLVIKPVSYRCLVDLDFKTLCGRKETSDCVSSEVGLAGNKACPNCLKILFEIRDALRNRRKSNPAGKSLWKRIWEKFW